MKGLILWHKTFGFCKVTDFNAQRRSLSVRFCGSERDVQYAIDAVRREFVRKMLPLESFAVVQGRGSCRIVRLPAASRFNGDEVFEYVVQFDDTSDTASVTELVLEPLAAHPHETLLSRLSTPDPYSLWKVHAREAFLGALVALHRETQGLESLAASRIELYPHQAFVAAAVIADPVRRFILADEVGLGKTVEAGVVIHDLLADRPEARVLVLTPSALSRQWLCELHMSFGGQGSRLADLYAPSAVKVNDWSRLICSIERATLYQGQALCRAHWDMVVVDEAHRLLWSSDAYSIVGTLSANAGSLLLLSAVPARERADELLRLLQLIDKKRYAKGSTTAERFEELYRAQAQIGRRLRILDREITALRASEAMAADVATEVKRLVESPVVADDQELDKAAEVFGDLASADVVTEAIRIRNRVIDAYRLSRRIIKNRRAQLVARSLLEGVPRQCDIVEYEPDAFESECWSALRQVMSSLSATRVVPTVRNAFVKMALYSMAEPVFAFQVASALCLGETDAAVEAEIKLLDAGFGYSQDLQEHAVEVIGAATKKHIPPALANMWMRTAREWINGARSSPRFAALLEVVTRCMGRSQKVLVFSGVPGGADLLMRFLRERCGEAAVESFTYEMGDAQKEESVRRFRTKASCPVLVSDESGGEGRNFQFADVVVHFDLPWSVVAIEQRIGRLDRIGRKGPVKSFVICNRDCVERDYVRVLDDGFKVFTQSISGLEFMLREQEQRLLTAAVRGEIEDIDELVESIAAAAEEERRNDDAEALTDAASFKGGHALLSVTEISPDLDERIEAGFIGYFRALARHSSARQVPDDADPNVKLWLLRPDEVRNERLPGLQEAEGGVVAEHRGTCQRGVARERRGIEFFSVGNSLFDSIASVAMDRLTGRVFGIAIQSDHHQGGIYLYVRGRAVADEEVVGARIVLRRRSRAVLFGRHSSAIYELGRETPLPPSSLDDLVARALGSEVVVQDLGGDKLRGLIDASQVDWSEYLVRMQPLLINELRTRIEARHGSSFQSALEGIDCERKELVRTYLDATEEALSNLDSLACAIRGWKAAIDVIGVVSIQP